MAGKRKYLITFLLLALLLGGCGQSEKTKDSKYYTIYYTNLSGTRLENKRFVPESDRFDGILTELLDQFSDPGYSDVVSAMPLGVSINGYTMGVDDLQVDFNASYLGLSNVQEILLRSALVKTLVQLPGIARVRITVDGQPLKDSDGREVSAMNEESFIDSRGEGINSYHYVTLDLYFSNAAGDKVVKEMRNVFYSSNLIIEKVIVEQIIRGPANEKLLAVANPSVLVKSVKISKNVCVIDLDSRFNNEPGSASVKPETCLYAFVNAICDACDVEGVKFKIDGESNVRFRGKVNLDRVFQRNADIIEATGVTEPLAEIFLDDRGAETEFSAVTGDSSLTVSGTAETEALKEDNSSSQASEEKTQNQTDQAGENGKSDPKKENGTEQASGSSEDTDAAFSDQSKPATASQGKGVGVDPALVEEGS